MPTPTQPPHATRSITPTQGAESPPLTLGPKRLHYQFSSALPQVHLTFVSIVQGIAFGVLLQDLPVPKRTDLAYLGAFLLVQRLYLPWIISGLLIVIIWKQFVQASLLYLWPLSAAQSALMLLIAVAETIAFREIHHLNAWIVGFGVVAFIGGGIRLNNLRLLKALEYESANARKGDGVSAVFTGLSYMALGLLVITSGLTLHYLMMPAQLALILSWAAIALLLGIIIGVLIVDYLGIKQLITDSIEGSDLEYVAPGSLRYRPAPHPEAKAPPDHSASHDS